MIFDLNLSELPEYKNYDGFLLELLNIDDEKYKKEITRVLKTFSKSAVNQIFADFAFFTLRNYLKRCKFGFCNFWNKNKYQPNFYESGTWFESFLALSLPLFGSLMISLISIQIFLPDFFTNKDLDSFQYFYVCFYSMVQTGLFVFIYGLVYELISAFMISSTYTEFLLKYFGKLAKFSWQDSFPILQTVMMMTAFFTTLFLFLH